PGSCRRTAAASCGTNPPARATAAVTCCAMDRITTREPTEGDRESFRGWNVFNRGSGIVSRHGKAFQKSVFGAPEGSGTGVERRFWGKPKVLTAPELLDKRDRNDSRPRVDV